MRFQSGLRFISLSPRAIQSGARRKRNESQCCCAGMPMAVTSRGVACRKRRRKNSPCTREDVLVMAGMKHMLRLLAYCERQALIFLRATMCATVHRGRVGEPRQGLPVKLASLAVVRLVLESAHLDAESGVLGCGLHSRHVVVWDRQRGRQCQALPGRQTHRGGERGKASEDAR